MVRAGTDHSRLKSPRNRFMYSSSCGCGSFGTNILPKQLHEWTSVVTKSLQTGMCWYRYKKIVPDFTAGGSPEDVIELDPRQRCTCLSWHQAHNAHRFFVTPFPEGSFGPPSTRFNCRYYTWDSAALSGVHNDGGLPSLTHFPPSLPQFS